jgi:hypothetical protein
MMKSGPLTTYEAILRDEVHRQAEIIDSFHGWGEMMFKEYDRMVLHLERCRAATRRKKPVPRPIYQSSRSA